MSPLEFLRSEAVAALLDRAATVAGVPLSIHYVERNQEGPRILGIGQCEVCRHVQSLPGGGAACRFSRATAANMALRQRRPMPFICHLGLACVSAPALPGENFVMTVGPFVPMEEQRSLEGDVRAGFSNLLGRETVELPVSLADLHHAPAASLPALVTWTLEALQSAWKAQALDNALSAAEPLIAVAPLAPARRGASTRDRPAPGTIQTTVAALAAGDFQQARALLKGDLEEFSRAQGRSIERRRARMASMASAVLEGLTASGLEVSAAWPAFPGLVEALASGSDDRAFLDAAMKFFSFLRREQVREQVVTCLPNYPELFALVNERLPEPVTLEEVAAALGQTPSAISHRLKRKFGMSFSDYVGHIRVERAKRLFRESTLGPLEVGKRIGIADPSNFARLFRKVAGISPAAYRKQYGKKS